MFHVEQPGCRAPDIALCSEPTPPRLLPPNELGIAEMVLSQPVAFLVD